MTIKDIARLSGCGIGTVSRVINNQPGVSDATREKILAVIKESNYEPNENARQLKMRTGASVCIIMKGRNNALFSDVSERCMLTLSSMEEDAIIDVIDEDGDEIEEALRLIRNNSPKGIIFLGANLGLFDERMQEIEIPCVIATTSAASLEWKNVSSVSVDDETATSEMVQYLCNHGHKNIVVVGGYLSKNQISYARYLGCRKGIEACGLSFDSEQNYVACRYSMKAGYDAVKELLSRNSDVTAIVALSDTIAFGAMRAIQDSGRRVPEDISVTGFDGIELAQFSIPRITTIKQDTQHIATRSVELLIKHIHYNLKSEHDIAPHSLIEGESVRTL